MIPTLIAATTPLRTKTLGDFRIYEDPRVSANQLALFAVSGDAKKESIVRDAKKVNTAKVANYKPARIAVYNCYDGNSINAAALTAEAERLKSAALPGSFDESCNKLSSAVLQKLIPLTANIECSGVKISRPPRAFDHLLIEGVRVSVQPEVVFSMTHRGATRFGGVIANFSKSEPFDIRTGKYCAGDYAAFLIFQMLALRFGNEGGPRYGSCVAVDVHRGGIFPAPSSYVTMLKNIQAACRSIARQWNELPD